MKKNKKTIVNRSFLTKLADTIYNPKTEKFLHLCKGTLQNGPDPTNKRRTSLGRSESPRSFARRPSSCRPDAR